MLKNRLLWADAIRSLAIMLVIATHLNHIPNNVTIYNIHFFILAILTRSGVPLFVMLSGTLLLPQKGGYFTFFLKRIKRICAPWIFWTTVFLFIQNGYFTIHDISSFFKAYAITAQSFWFLPVILSLYLVTPALRIFVQHAKPHDILYIILLWFFFVSIMSPVQYLPSNLPKSLLDNALIRQTVNFIGYYLLGHYLINIKRHKIKFHLDYLLIFATGLLWFLLRLFTNKQHFNLSSYIAPETVLISVGVFVFTYKFITVCTNYVGNKIRKIIESISNASLGIYIISGFVRIFLQNNFGFSTSSFTNGLASIAATFIICFLIIFSLQQIPYLKRLIS